MRREASYFPEYVDVDGWYYMPSSSGKKVDGESTSARNKITRWRGFAQNVFHLERKVITIERSLSTDTRLKELFYIFKKKYDSIQRMYTRWKWLGLEIIFVMKNMFACMHSYFHTYIYIRMGLRIMHCINCMYDFFWLS